MAAIRPITAAETGISTLDVGVQTLGMHSIRSLQVTRTHMLYFGVESFLGYGRYWLNVGILTPIATKFPVVKLYFY